MGFLFPRLGLPFNIYEGINSTILILKHRLKANEQRPAIEAITD
ncbi:hypothetical protein ACWATR_22865 [Nostoc sp. UIC 10890]